MIRKATMADVPAMHQLITFHAELNRMLFRSHAHLYEHLRDFFVFVEPVEGRERVRGCVALELIWKELGEVKSLAVDEQCRGRGIGRKLVEATRAEAAQLSLTRLFALTREQEFFARVGFAVVPKESLPHKVWTDCIKCSMQANCDEVAMVCAIAPA